MSEVPSAVQIMDKVESMGGMLYYSHQRQKWVFTMNPRTARELKLPIVAYFDTTFDPVLLDYIGRA
jgi:hypothetical protein